MKFSEIWCVDASQQINIHLKARFSILAFSCHFAFFCLFCSFLPFLAIRQDLNRSMKFSKILFVDASLQIKTESRFKFRFSILAFFSLFKPY